MLNHPQGHQFVKFLILHGGVPTCTKYIKYKQSPPLHELKGVMGFGDPVHWQYLHLPSQYKGIPIMTLPQQKVFNQGTQGSTLVNEAIHKMDNWAISVEVQFYQTSCSCLNEAHTQLAKQHQLVSKLATDAKESIIDFHRRMSINISKII